MASLGWLAAAVVLGIAAYRLVRAIQVQAESQDEFTAALLAYAAPIPGAIVMTLAVFGSSPMLLVMPAIVYVYVLLITRAQPLLLLGFFIDRIDRRRSDRYAARLIGLILLTVLIGGSVSFLV
jgi:hypothetical protein